MAKGFGIAALILSIVGAFVPILGFWIGVFALILATIGTLAGDRIFGIATICVSVVVFLFLSPLLWGAVVGAGSADERVGLILVAVAVFAPCLPVLGIILNATGKVALGAGKSGGES